MNTFLSADGSYRTTIFDNGCWVEEIVSEDPPPSNMVTASHVWFNLTDTEQDQLLASSAAIAVRFRFALQSNMAIPRAKALSVLTSVLGAVRATEILA